MGIKVKKFELSFIEDNPPVIDDIPGITDLALDYASSIGGATAPEEGADVTADNSQGVSWLTDAGALAALDQVAAAQIVNGAVEKVKMALLSVDADILAASAVTTVKIDDNAITSPKILAGAVIAGKIAANAVTADEINVSELSAINADIGSITAGSITGITINGGTINVKSGSTALITLDSSGYTQFGQFMTFKSSGGTSVGQIYAENTSNFLMNSFNGKTLEVLGADGVIINAGDNNLDLRGGNTTHIRIDASNSYGGYVGTSSRVFSSGYFTTIYFARSGQTSKYIQMGSGGDVETNGNFFVGGTLSKSAGTFKIDHPLKPDTHHLQHSFVESPEMLNLYTGQAIFHDQECKITMPDWFIALNGKDFSEYTYQLTSRGRNTLWVQEEMNEAGEVVFGSEFDGKFYYMITAVRHDKYALENPIEVEVKK